MPFKTTRTHLIEGPQLHRPDPVLGLVFFLATESRGEYPTWQSWGKQEPKKKLGKD